MEVNTTPESVVYSFRPRTEFYIGNPHTRVTTNGYFLSRIQAQTHVSAILKKTGLALDMYKDRTKAYSNPR